MLVRLRSTLFAWGGALVLAVSATGLVAAASLVGDTAPQVDTQVTTPTTSATFTDTNGDGIDDTCQAAVTADQAAADAAVKAADTNGDGTISVSEAAHTDWVGGPNCNHGGYVSTVAGTSGADQETTDPTDPTDQQQPKTCDTTTPEAPTAPAGDQTPTDVAPNAHGLAVSTVAQDETAIGGKNCNHGGAVSAAAHQGKDHGNGPQSNATKQPKGKGHRWGHNKP